MKYGQFKDASGTIHFIRVIDQLFDVLNIRNPYGKGFKKPLKLSDRMRWESVLSNSITYLSQLTVNGVPLLAHRRKTFVVGFILALSSVRKIAMQLLARPQNSLQYLLTYKMSQDHLELLFACIRGKNGFNNNPNVIQFKSTLRKLLLKNAITSSKYANCMTFEESCSPIFSLKWSKTRAPLINHRPMIDKAEDDAEIKALCLNLESYNLSEYQDAILGYISGYLVRKLTDRITCSYCAEALIQEKISRDDHNYSIKKSLPYLALIQVKDRGGLITPSAGVVTVVRQAEKLFRAAVCGFNSLNPKISIKDHLSQNLCESIYEKVISYDLFPSLRNHDDDFEIGYEDLHSVQLIKKIIKEFFTIRFLTYGQHYTKTVIQKHKIGYRQQSNKLVLFSNV